jgi:hypothetical protein
VLGIVQSDFRDGFLTAEGGQRSNGIGSGLNHLCGSLTFLNGTFDATAGTLGGSGIGSRRGDSGSSTVLGLTITGGKLTGHGSYWAVLRPVRPRPGFDGFGSGNLRRQRDRGRVGRGRRWPRLWLQRRVDRFRFDDTTATASDGAGIGSRSGHSTVFDFAIAGGIVNATATKGGGIGSGYGYETTLSIAFALPAAT